MTHDPRDAVSDEGEWYGSPPARLAYLPVTTPDSGQVVELFPGLHWIRMPLPIDLAHINLWLLEDAGGWTLVDTGMNAPMCREVWQRLESDLLRQRPLARIVLTHCHPDHMGLAAWLAERHRVPVWISEPELDAARRLCSQDPARIATGLDFFRIHGAPDPEEFLPQITGDGYRRVVSGLPPVAGFLRDCDVIDVGPRRFDVLETGGHADGHCALYDAAQRILVSGDQILPTISSNISLTPHTVIADPLRAYLESLQRFAGLPADTIVLPSHGRPFQGLVNRTSDLTAHHRQQLAAVVDACRRPLTAWDLMPFLYRRELRGLHRLLGLAEVIAHAEFLAHRGELERRPSAGGVVHYAVA